MAHDKITLHEAIEIVLSDAGESQTAAQIARAVNERMLYVRGDGTPLPSSQIKLRVKNYPHLFERVDDQISLLSGRR